MIKWIRWPFFILAWVLTPSFWRAVFFGHIRIAIYLSSGQTIKINCVNWKTSGQPGSKSWEITGNTDNFFADAGAIIGWKEVRWW